MRSLKKFTSSVSHWTSNKRERSHSAPPHPTSSFMRRTTSQTEEKAEDTSDLMAMFRLFDSNHKGYIEASQIRQVLSVLRSNKTMQDEMIGKEELEQLLRDVHLEQDRKINFEEFVKLLDPSPGD